MPNEYKQLSMHKKIEILVNELVENELPLKDALKEFEKICDHYDARLAIKDEIIRRLDLKIAKNAFIRQNLSLTR